jgi:hypothetical protein
LIFPGHVQDPGQSRLDLFLERSEFQVATAADCENLSGLVAVPSDSLLLIIKRVDQGME